MDTHTMRAAATRCVRSGTSIVKRLALRYSVGQWRIRRTQNRRLKTDFDPVAEKLIVILTPGNDTVTGGILSIASIFAETMKLKGLHQSEVLMCTVPGDPLLLNYTKFKNDNHLFEFSGILNHFTNLNEIMIHIPEYCIKQFLRNLSSEDCQNLKKIKTIRINVMLQNIKLLSDFKLPASLKEFGLVTCTTAHEQYSSLEIRTSLGVPLHKLSVYLSPEQYSCSKFIERSDLMIVSPDTNPRKSDILGLISKEFPSMQIQIIQNLTYDEFKTAISHAKWALTFGEGLDGYFVETIFSGGIGFAVYNSDFFTQNFKSLQTVYESYDALAKRICSDICELNRENEYSEYQSKQFALCAKYYNYGDYILNLKLFYEGKYTYP